jgi:phosphoribosylformimino-5-aminoimidazole carboxamide ribotide isomerase
MRVIPVIDLQGGLVVHGVAGQRDSYRPVRSRLGMSASPFENARAFAERLHREEVYVADLDAIGGREISHDALRAIAAAGLRLWVDAGPRTAADALRLAQLNSHQADTLVDRVILGLESVDGPSTVAAVVRELGAARVIFSLDLRSGRPITGAAAWQRAEPIDIARQVYELGVRQMIVLDLARVGTGDGVPTGPLCRRILERLPGVEVITGGGLGEVAEVAELAASGVHGVLVASALHDGRLGKDELDAIEGNDRQASVS